MWQFDMAFWCNILMWHVDVTLSCTIAFLSGILIWYFDTKTYIAVVATLG